MLDSHLFWIELSALLVPLIGHFPLKVTQNVQEKS